MPQAAPGVFPADVSHDGSQLLVIRGTFLLSPGSVWTLPVLGGSGRRLSDILALDARWSPGGDKLVYSAGRELYIAKGDGTESSKLVTLPGPALWLRWSPDGTRLRFTLSRRADLGSSAIWKVRLDGSQLHQILAGWNNPPAECCGSWTADSRYFVFQATRGGISNVWAVREGASLLRRVTQEPVQLTSGPTNTGLPALDPDGKQVFVQTRQARGELVRWDAGTREIRPFLSGIQASALDFSKDGKWVAYVAFPDGNLWRSRTDGSERLQLSFPPVAAFMPRWSPDGTQIAFMGRGPGRPSRIYLVPTEGGALQQPIPGDQNQSDPNWSPDGNSLVFGGQILPESDATRLNAIRIFELKTHQVSALPGSEGLWSPRWSMNGRSIIAMSNNGRKLLVFDFSQHTWSLLAEGAIAYPQWSHRGEYVYFLSSLPGGNVIYRVRLSDRRQEEVLDLKSFRQAPMTMGGWMGIDPGDAPLLVRDAGTQDIHALTLDLP
jgi:Tol biopolymer transport system component